VKVALIPCDATEWRQQGRLLGRVELPIDSAARSDEAWLAPLRAVPLDVIYYAPDDLCSATARRIGRSLGVPARKLRDLEEVDIGLWTGLTEEELAQRYASSYRQLHDAPLTVVPPEGESLGDAARRLKACIERRMRQNGLGGVAFVLRPLARAMACCLLAGEDLGQVWERMREHDRLQVIEAGRRDAAPRSV
jgi:probable phosphoglycerate mutase